MTTDLKPPAIMITVEHPKGVPPFARVLDDNSEEIHRVQQGEYWTATIQHLFGEGSVERIEIKQPRIDRHIIVDMTDNSGDCDHCGRPMGPHGCCERILSLQNYQTSLVQSQVSASPMIFRVGELFESLGDEQLRWLDADPEMASIHTSFKSAAVRDLFLEYRAWKRREDTPDLKGERCEACAGSGSTISDCEVCNGSGVE